VPLEQDEVPGHTVPQAPQLLLSVAVFTHAPPHEVVPAGQAQAPAAQLVPPVQALPQAPQLALSVDVSTQAPPQAVVPAGQVHTPATQDLPPVQALPQAPQLALSVDVFTQAAPHLVWPAGQPPLQTPAVQVVPVGHTWPQAPQFLESVFRLVSQRGCCAMNASHTLRAAARARRARWHSAIAVRVFACVHRRSTSACAGASSLSQRSSGAPGQ
jgi:hypothetical protein